MPQTIFPLEKSCGHRDKVSNASNVQTKRVVIAITLLALLAPAYKRVILNKQKVIELAIKYLYGNRLGP
jgi:hypothetical protein